MLVMHFAIDQFAIYDQDYICKSKDTVIRVNALHFNWSPNIIKHSTEPCFLFMHQSMWHTRGEWWTYSWDSDTEDVSEFPPSVMVLCQNHPRSLLSILMFITKFIVRIPHGQQGHVRIPRWDKSILSDSPGLEDYIIWIPRVGKMYLLRISGLEKCISSESQSCRNVFP